MHGPFFALRRSSLKRMQMARLRNRGLRLMTMPQQVFACSSAPCYR